MPASAGPHEPLILRTEECGEPARLRQRRRWPSSKAPNLVHQVSLIGKPIMRGNVGAALDAKCIEGALESHDPTEEPRRESNLLAKTAFELPTAHPMALRKKIDRRVAACPFELSDRAADRALRSPRRSS